MNIAEKHEIESRFSETFKSEEFFLHKIFSSINLTVEDDIFTKYQDLRFDKLSINFYMELDDLSRRVDTEEVLRNMLQYE